MVCEKCKVRPAEKKLTQTTDGVTTTIYLCRECLDRMSDRRVENIYRCRYCGRSFDEINDTWIVGCERCYEQFADKLEPIIRRAQKVDEL